MINNEELEARKEAKRKYAREWQRQDRLKHPEKYKRYNKTNHDRNGHKYKDRQRKVSKQWKLDNPDKVKESAQRCFVRLKEDNYAKYLLKTSRSRAKRAGLEHALSLEDIIVPALCPILQIEIKPATGGKAMPYSPSLDRIDNTKGYIPGNVRVISHRANSNKGSMTVEEVERLLRYMKGEL